MIQRIELHNFMSHADSVLELAEGLTVLVGPNNSGKSAVVEALRILCSNDRSKYAVRHGERECSVVVETDDGHRVEWRRQRDSVSYSIDGEEFDRLGGRVPEELHRVLRLPSVEAEGNSFDLHFGDQKAPIFLLDLPPSHAAQFFASSSDASKLVEMQGLHRQKTAAARSERRRLGAGLAGHRLRREQLQGVPRLAELIGDLEERSERLGAAASETDVMRRMRGDLVRAAQRKEGLESEVGALAGLVAPPTMGEVGPLVALVGRMRVVRGQARRAGHVFEAISPVLTSPPDLQDPDALAGVGRGIRLARSELAACGAACDVVASLRPPPELEDEHAVRRTVDRLGAASIRRQCLAAETELLKGLSQPPQEPDAGDLIAAVDALGSVRLDLAAARRGIEALETELARVEGEVRQWAETEKVCPTCGVELDPEVVVRTALTGRGAHSHE